MRGLLQLLLQNSSLLLFLLLEGLCFYLIVRFNDRQQLIWLSTSSAVVGTLNKTADNFVTYFSYGKQNAELLAENAALRQRLHELLIMRGDTLVGDSITREDLPLLLRDTATADKRFKKYRFIPVHVISNSITSENNYLTLDKGANDGVKEGMGVISSTGIVGIIVNKSARYATAMSILHRQAKISAAIRRTGYFGALVWKGNDSRYMYLEAIPRHETIQVGDTIQTSGYSSIFPPAIMIGVVQKAYTDGEYWVIQVELSNNLGRLDHAYIVINQDAEEIREIEAAQNQ